METKKPKKKSLFALQRERLRAQKKLKGQQGQTSFPETFKINKKDQNQKLKKPINQTNRKDKTKQNGNQKYKNKQNGNGIQKEVSYTKMSGLLKNVVDTGGLKMKEFQEMNQKNIKQIINMPEKNILQEIAELKSMIPAELLKNIKSRNIFMKKVNESVNNYDKMDQNMEKMNFYNEELKKEDVIARSQKNPQNSLGIFTDFAFDAQGEYVGKHQPKQIKQAYESNIHNFKQLFQNLLDSSSITTRHYGIDKLLKIIGNLKNKVNQDQFVIGNFTVQVLDFVTFLILFNETSLLKRIPFYLEDSNISISLKTFQLYLGLLEMIYEYDLEIGLTYATLIPKNVLNSLDYQDNLQINVIEIMQQANERILLSFVNYNVLQNIFFSFDSLSYYIHLMNLYILNRKVSFAPFIKQHLFVMTNKMKVNHKLSFFFIILKTDEYKNQIQDIKDIQNTQKQQISNKLQLAIEEFIKLSIISEDLEIHQYSLDAIDILLDLQNELDIKNFSFSIKKDWFVDFILRLDSKSKLFTKLINTIINQSENLKIEDQLIVINFLEDKEKVFEDKLTQGLTKNNFIENQIDFQTMIRTYNYLKQRNLEQSSQALDQIFKYINQKAQQKCDHFKIWKRIYSLNIQGRNLKTQNHQQVQKIVSPSILFLLKTNIFNNDLALEFQNILYQELVKGINLITKLDLEYFSQRKKEKEIFKQTISLLFSQFLIIVQQAQKYINSLMQQKLKVSQSLISLLYFIQLMIPQYCSDDKVQKRYKLEKVNGGFEIRSFDNQIKTNLLNLNFLKAKAQPNKYQKLKSFNDNFIIHPKEFLIDI